MKLFKDKQETVEPEIRVRQSAPGAAPGQSLVRAVSASPELSASERAEQDREEQQLQLITQAWRVLRHEIDVAVDDYYRTGKWTKLEAAVREPILGAMKAHLVDLRKQHVVWTQPKRRQLTEPHFEIVEAKLAPAGRDEHFRFIVREDFIDRSLIQLWEDGKPVDEMPIPNRPTAIEATVAVLKGNRYCLVALYSRDPKPLDD